MGMAVTYYTADMARTLPEDGRRYEVVHGELLVTPTPRHVHQRTVTRLVTALSRYLEAQPIGEALVSPADISWSAETLVQPDVFVVPLEEARTLDWQSMKTLLLAIEVLSLSTARADHFTKRRLYQEVGVPTYWIVDPDRRCVEVWTPEAAFPTVEWEAVTWRPTGADQAFTMRLEDLFRAV
jgi:Uma2 family endonuclease